MPGMTLAQLWGIFPFLRKLGSSVFILAILPLLLFLTGMVPEEKLKLIMVLSWGAAGVVVVQDLSNAVIRRLGGNKPEPDPAKPPSPPQPPTPT